MRWPRLLAGSTPKRILIRLTALGGVLSLGVIAIAQAQRFGDKTPPEKTAAAATPPATPGPLTSAPTQPTTGHDPFAATRLASGPTRPAAAPSPKPSAFLEQTREAFPASTPAAADPLSQPAVRGQDTATATPPPAGHNRYGEAPRSRYGDPFAGDRYGTSTTVPPQTTEPTPAPTQPDRYGSAAVITPEPAQAESPQDRYGSAAASEPGGATARFKQEPAPAERSAPPATLPDTGEPARLPANADNPLRQMPAARGSEVYNAPIGRLTSNSLTAGEEGTGKPGQAQLEGAQAPSVTIEKFAPAEVQVGKPATFEILVRNVGQVRATDVKVEDQVPRKTRLVGTSPEARREADGNLVWNIGNLEPGEERTVKMEVSPVDEGEVGSVALVSFTAASSAKTVATRPELKLEVSAPKEVLIGTDAPLVIKISNPGTGPATGVVLREIVPQNFTHAGGGELEYEVGELKPGETRELELTLSAAKAGRAENVLTARGDGTLKADSVTELNVVAPALAVAMTGPKRRFLEREATYAVSITNPGTASAREIELVTYLPKGLDFVRADNYGEYDPQTRAVRWSLEELPANEAGNVTLTCMPVEAGEHKVLIEGKAERGLEAKQAMAITVEGVAAILFQVLDVEDPIEVNGETTYEIQVVNQGSKAATEVQLEAVLPPQMRPLSAEGPVRHEISGSTVVFDKLPRLAPKADTTYRVKAKGLAPGDMRVRIRVLTAEITTPIVKEESTRIYADE
jgi:uncharacterized repeat protein (TIGR01451 family)